MDENLLWPLILVCDSVLPFSSIDLNLTSIFSDGAATLGITADVPWSRTLTMLFRVNVHAIAVSGDLYSFSDSPTPVTALCWATGAVHGDQSLQDVHFP